MSEFYPVLHICEVQFVTNYTGPAHSVPYTAKMRRKPALYCAGYVRMKAFSRSETVFLPVPPSVNATYRNRTHKDSPKARGRIKTPAYARWEAEADAEVMRQRPAKVSGPVVVSLLIARPSPRSDVDNLIKPLVDFLVRANLIDDDRNVTTVAATWAPREFGRCQVTITSTDQ